MGRLTKRGSEKPTILTNRLSSPFTLCFKYKLENGYTFDEMNAAQIKDFQKFLNLASQMTFQEVERRYRRKSDTCDTFSGDQVIHYGITEGFRIHGTIEQGQFVVLRLDPAHKFHKS